VQPVLGRLLRSSEKRELAGYLKKWLLGLGSTSAAKAGIDCWTYGTTEVVPFPILGRTLIAALGALRHPKSTSWIGMLGSGEILSIGRSYTNAAKVKERRGI
jgi:hypothetical protein